MVTSFLATIFVAFLVDVTVAVDSNRELQLVHVIFRHGERTPADTYPNDPYINDTFAPVGWGQLTNPGKNFMYNNGKFVRERYNDFLGEHYNGNLYYAQSTDADRTKMSAQLMNAGVFPPKGNQKWGDLDWQPIPVNYEVLSLDSLLLVRKPCAQYSLEFEKVKNEGEIKKILDDNKELYEKLTKITGMDIKIFEDVQSLYSTLKAEESFGLKLPDWTKDYYPDKLLPSTIMDFVMNVYNNKMKRLKGGPFLKKILADYYNAIIRSGKTGQISEEDVQKAISPFSVYKDWQKQAASYGKFPIERKAYMYGGHDSTISNLLSVFNVWDPQVPVYGITILLEFSRDKTTNEFGVEIYLRNTTAVPPFKLTIPGCESFCPISKLTKLLEPVVPYNWDEECKSDDPNYVPPPPGGP